IQRDEKQRGTDQPSDDRGNYEENEEAPVRFPLEEAQQYPPKLVPKIYHGRQERAAVKENCAAQRLLVVHAEEEFPGQSNDRFRAYREPFRYPLNYTKNYGCKVIPSDAPGT